jgi:Family of unknown function (DUF5519)
VNRAAIVEHRKVLAECGMRNLERLEHELSSWPEVSVHPHRFGGREFRFRAAEIGHIHTGGIVDIPFPRSIHDALLEEGLAGEHRWVPNSGWITFRIRGPQDLNHALWLMRLSYTRYALKNASDPHEMFERESEKLRLHARTKSLLEPFIPKPAKQFPTEPVPA